MPNFLEIREAETDILLSKLDGLSLQDSDPYKLLEYTLTRLRNPIRIASNNEGCWLVTDREPLKSGYIQVKVTNKPALRLHKAIWEACNRKCYTGEVVMHLCNNKACINPEHLSAGSQGKNAEQATLDGLMSKKLSEEEVKQIRYEEEGTDREVAAKFGVTYVTVSRIRQRETWKHLYQGETR